jgi:hypothetical protein
MMNHKRVYSAIALAAIVAMPVAASAQGGMGIKAGFSWGQVPNNGGAFPGELSAHNGAAIGVGLHSGGVVGWGVEGLYAERGFRSSSPGGSRRMAVIDVPVYLRLAAENPGLTPFGYVGPQASFEVRCDGGGGNCPTDRKKIGYAGVIGAGLKFGGLAGITAEARYVYGLTDLHLSTVTTSENYRSRGFMILAGFGF